MNDLGNKYALAALKDKRASLAGEISHLKRQLSMKQDQLAHIDATLGLFDPKTDPESIPKKRSYKHIRLFKQGELCRLIFDVLRRAQAPLSTAEIAALVINAMDHNEALRPTMSQRVRGTLAYLDSRGSVKKIGTGAAARWALIAE